MRKVLFLLIILSCFGCQKSEHEDFQVGEKILNEDGSMVFIENIKFHENLVILFIMYEDFTNGRIDAFDRKNLELVWSWEEGSLKYGQKGFSAFSHIHDGILAVSKRKLSFGIDLKTGKTIWENESELPGTTVFGEGRNIYTASYFFDELTLIQKADINYGKWETLMEFKREDELNISSTNPFGFKWEGKSYMFIVRTKWLNSDIRHYWLNLYNVTDDVHVWETDTIQLEHHLSGIPGKIPAFEDGQILLANDAIYSYNVEDGSLQFRKFYGNGFHLLSHIDAGDGKVYGNNEDQYCVGLDVKSGNEIWKTTTGGSSGFLKYEAGHVFLSSLSISGVGNTLTILDGETGEIKHSILAPYNDSHDLDFGSNVGIDPETGFVYAHDRKHLLVYDFGL